MLGKVDRVRLKKISELIYNASREVKILRHLNWPVSVRYKFFKSGSEKLPQVEYPEFDPSLIFSRLKKARGLLGDTPFDDWLEKKTHDIEAGAHLIANCGTERFHKYSSNIYGIPKEMLRDGETTPIELATRFRSIFDHYEKSDIAQQNVKSIRPEEICDRIQSRVKEVFADESPKVILADGISAKATASSKRIRIRKGASFTEKDIDQLINHEALVHVATTLNGRAQQNMKILGANYGGVTKTQEGLAVFSEFITGCIDVKRMYRVLDRVLAIQMAIDGADFIEVYRFFLPRTKLKTQAYENTRRIFRGAPLTGRFPFTKDIVYLDGMVRVHNFFRAAVANSRLDLIELLFWGKLDLDDIPIIKKLKDEDILKKPKYLPYWVKDLNYLISFFTFSIFVGQMDHDRSDAYYASLF